MADSFTDLMRDARAALALDLARLAAEIIAPAFFRPVNASDKSADDTAFDPVTATDTAAEQAMRQRIERAFPDDGIIGEEFGDTATNAEWQWLLDPIDGTRAFLCGLPGFATLITLLRNGSPVLGLIHDPLTGTTTIGDNTSCWRVRGDEATPMHAATVERLEQALAGTTLPRLYDTPGKRAFLAAVQQRVKHLQFDADASFYAALAQGRMHLAFDTGLKSFDAAALIPVVRGAGGVITDWRGNTAPLGGDIIASASPALHERMLTLLAETGAAAESQQAGED